MKRLLSIFLALLLSAPSLVQAQNGDTIWVDSKGTTTLLLPYKVDLEEIGNDAFAAQADGQLVLIKATKPTYGFTNLTVRYGVDNYFTGYIHYKKQVENRYHDFRVTLNPFQLDSLRMVEAEPKPTIKAELVAKLLTQNRPKPEAIPLVVAEEDQIKISLLAVRNGPELTYLWLELENLTSLPYHLRQVNVHFRAKARSRRMADIVIKRPLISPQLPETVLPYGKAGFCFAIPHFASGKKSQLEILVGERSGDRVVMLKVKNSFIMNALILNHNENSTH